MGEKTIPDKFLYLPAIIVGVYFLFRLINQSKIMWIFPLDKYNDWSSYMAQLYFLKTCGFHNLCQYWYNGFINFQINQPGWYFFAYPIYLITNNVQLTAYISLILILILSFIAIYILGKKLDLSKTKIITFFLFFFGNAVAIGNYIRVGKIHELFGWLNSIVIFLFLLFYKDKKLDKNFFFIIPFYFFAVLSHQNSAIISSLAILGLFLIKNFKEKLLIIYSVLITIILTSFWWIDYIKNFFNTTSATIIVANTLRTINRATLNDNIVAFLVPLAFFIVFYFYLKSSQNRKKEFIFFLPMNIIAFLILTRLILFIPIINHVFPDSYSLFLFFFTLFMLFKLDLKLIKNYKVFIIIGLLLFSIASVTLNIIFTPLFIEHTELEKETLSLFSNVEGKFVLLATPLRRTSYPNAYYSYAPIYYNLSTAGGWYPSMTDQNYLNKVDNLDNLIRARNCELLKKEIHELNVSEIITYDSNCEFLNKCGFNKKVNKSRVCLYST